ncbi:calcium-binding protein [Xenophilus aerolatus]
MRLLLLRYALLALLAGAMLPARAQAPDPARQDQMRTELRKRFGAADANVDGRLTRDEAKGRMPWVYRNFEAIDSAHTGAVTMEQIEAYAASRRGRRAAGG